MKSPNPPLSRKPEERIKFKYLVQMLVWAKRKTGRPSSEIVGVILKKGRFEVDRALIASL
ncbi:MAG TPA: hypothetical protein PKA10_01030 [Selenomonadales bacterium]|nr:hypothetical protein [Selenomonadales bacterium]